MNKILTIRCDADPSVLSDYIIALLKHDKSREELQASCSVQLEDFLRDETSSFVENLFSYLDEHFYSFSAKRPNVSASVVEESSDGEEEKRKSRRIESERQPRFENAFEEEPVLRNSMRCRDFETKGYCVRGDTCPYEHENSSLTISSTVEMPRAKSGSFGKRFDDRTFKPKRKENTCTKLVIEKVPIEFCTVAQIHDFFSKFGTLVNVNLDEAGRKASIQYSSPSEAQKAYQSPEPVFNNRFVKVYWDKSEAPTAENIVKSNSPVFIAESIIPPKIAAKKKKQENLQALLEIQKKKYALLESSISQQKILLGKLSNKSLSEAERKAIMDSLKPIEEAIKSIMSSIDNDKKQTEEEILKQKLESLKSEAKTLGIATEDISSTHKPILKGGFVNRSMKLDNRPTVLILGSHSSVTSEEVQKFFGLMKGVSKSEEVENGFEIEFSNRDFGDKSVKLLQETDWGKEMSISWKFKSEQK